MKVTEVIIIKTDDDIFVFTDLEKLKQCWDTTFCKCERTPQLIVPAAFNDPIELETGIIVTRKYVNEVHL